jgi:hypothetical protein
MLAKSTPKRRGRALWEMTKKQRAHKHAHPNEVGLYSESGRKQELSHDAEHECYHEQKQDSLELKSK